MADKRIILNSNTNEGDLHNNQSVQNTQNANPVNSEERPEPSRFAGELPDWDLVPPAIIVRRVKRAI